MLAYIRAYIYFLDYIIINNKVTQLNLLLLVFYFVPCGNDKISLLAFMSRKSQILLL